MPARDAEPRDRSQRQLRVAEQMRHLLAEHLLRGELHDPRLAGTSLTVSEVRVSRDLKNATVFTAALGMEPGREVLAALQHASAHLGGWLARQMHLKYAPRLSFVADESFAKADRIERMLLSEPALHHHEDEDADDGPA
ncbi:MAG: 30S ribosome-binding factor RbfA [Geminicoccaceae bacterium]